MSDPPSDSAEIGGIVQSVVFHNEENGYTIMQVVDEGGGHLTVRGKLPAAVAGEKIKATGPWKSDRRFGRQFDATRITAQPPDSPEGIVRFLSSGLIDGIGHLHPVLKLRFGEKVVIRNIQQAQGWGIRRLGFGVQVPDIAESAMDALETRALWARFGL
jgi:hypothetical protein